jgi:DNA-binding transcriptional MerR regulator
VKCLATYILKQKAKKQKRKVKVMNLEQVKTALLVYDATLPENDQLARKMAQFLKEEGVKADTLGFFNKKGKKVVLPKDELNYHYFSPLDLNWLKFPKSKKVIDLKKKKVDLLIDLNLNNHFSLESISTLSPAHFKVGASGSYRDEVCDLTLSMKDADMHNLIEQIKKYLSIINKKT